MMCAQTAAAGAAARSSNRVASVLTSFRVPQYRTPTKETVPYPDNRNTAIPDKCLEEERRTAHAAFCGGHVAYHS
eukprot:gene8152-5698_t